MKRTRRTAIEDLSIKKIVAYKRLSRAKKGRDKEETIEDAYGIEVQDSDIKSLASRCGAKIIAEYVEIETGTTTVNRPELAKAIAHARLSNATLVIGKLARLARDVHFISGLMNSAVDFACCDNPHATRFTLHILAAAAEEEVREIADRTRNGLAKARKKGVKLGSAREGHWKGREHLRGFAKATQASIVSRQQNARDAYGFLVPTIRELREKGEGLRGIAEWLNERDHLTTRGKPFTDVAVMRILRMFEGQAVPILQINI